MSEIDLGLRADPLFDFSFELAGIVIQAQQIVNADIDHDADVIAIASAHGEYAVALMFVRGGRSLGSTNFFPKAPLAESAEVLEAFVAQYYLERESPPKGTWAALPGGGEPELQFGGTDRDDVAVAENCILNRRVVDGGERVCGGCEFEAFLFLKFQGEVLIPDTVIFQLQFVSRRATNAERKMASRRLGARFFAGKNVQLNHQKRRRGTVT